MTNNVTLRAQGDLVPGVKIQKSGYEEPMGTVLAVDRNKQGTATSLAVEVPGHSFWNGRACPRGYARKRTDVYAIYEDHGRLLIGRVILSWGGGVS